jgi:hypothetical protein
VAITLVSFALTEGDISVILVSLRAKHFGDGLHLFAFDMLSIFYEFGAFTNSLFTTNP